MTGDGPRFDPATTALLAIDLQRAFCSADGSVARQGRDVSACAEAATRCFALVAEARAAGIPIFWTRMMFRPDYADGGVLVHELRTGMKAIGALRAGTEDVELIEGADVRPEDIVIDKCRFSALVGTPLELILREKGAKTLIVCGVTTSVCVESTVRDASQRDFLPYVVADACAELDPTRHDAALAVLEYGFAKIISGEAATAALRRARTAAE